MSQEQRVPGKTGASLSEKPVSADGKCISRNPRLYNDNVKPVCMYKKPDRCEPRCIEILFGLNIFPELNRIDCNT
jgi:hypothetical protein